MNIGIDIDDTITNSSEVFVKYAIKYNKEKKINYPIDTTTLDQEKAFGWNNNNKKEFASLYLKKILREANPHQDVVKVIRKLKDSGHKIFFITARTDEEVLGVYDFTREWLLNNNIYFDKLIVNSVDKVNICKANHINVFIDDNYETCKNVFEELNIPVLMFQTKYNEIFSDFNFECVKNWEEILYKINNGG